MFRWLIPEGMLIIWQEKKFQIDALEKAQEFYDHYISGEDEQDSREEGESKSQEDQMWKKLWNKRSKGNRMSGERRRQN